VDLTLNVFRENTNRLEALFRGERAVVQAGEEAEEELHGEGLGEEQPGKRRRETGGQGEEERLQKRDGDEMGGER
jgi:hypothetical protein